MGTPLSNLFARVTEARSALELVLQDEMAPIPEAVEALSRSRVAVEICLAWKGADDRERSVRSVADNAFRSCLDAIRMAEIGLSRGRWDMVEAASRNLGSAQQRLFAITRSLRS